MTRVTGIGSIFFKIIDPNATTAGYAKHLGFNIDEWGASFTTKKKEYPSKNAYLQWNPFQSNTNYLEPSQKDFMINYRVDNLETLANILWKEGVTICDEISSYDYGELVHIMDTDDNKIELWEHADEVFDDLYDKNKI